jgi:transcriptional regulator with XRE-family HTH domain
MLRERSGFSIEELAAAAGIDVDRLAGIEANEIDPGVTEFQRLVKAAGHRLITGVTRELREPDDARAVELLHNAVSNLLVVTDPANPLPEIGLTGWRRGPLGLFLVARENVREMLLLDALGHSYHAGPLIDRSVFEDVATAHWVADVPEERDTRFLRLIRDRNYYLEKLAAADPDGWNEILNHERQIWVSAGQPEAEFPAKLPPFEQRLTSGMETWYIRYRRLSLYLHPNSARVEDGLQTTDEGTFAKIEVASNPRDLAFAATLVWMLALRIELDWDPDQERTGLGFTGDIDAFQQLGLVLNTFTRDEPVTPGSPVYVPGPQDVGK